jgi:hypothetical protein
LDAAMEDIRFLKNIGAKQSILLEFKTEFLKQVIPSSSIDLSNATVSMTSHDKQTKSFEMLRFSQQ